MAGIIKVSMPRDSLPLATSLLNLFSDQHLEKQSAPSPQEFEPVIFSWRQEVSTLGGWLGRVWGSGVVGCQHWEGAKGVNDLLQWEDARSRNSQCTFGS